MMILVGGPAVCSWPGHFLADFIKTVLYESFAVIAASFVLGGVAILAIERLRPAPVVTNAMQTPLGRALAIGACQTLALVPGVSRSGATIMGAVALGLDRRAAAEFSFFLAVPTMTAAFAHEFPEVRSQLTPERSLARLPFGFVRPLWPRHWSSSPSFPSLAARASRRLRGIALPPGPRSRQPSSPGWCGLQWLRRSFIAGFFVTVPLFVSVAALRLAGRASSTI